MDSIQKWLSDEQHWASFVGTCIQLLGNLVLALLVLLVFWFMATLLRRFVMRVGERAKVNADVLLLLASTARLTVLAIGLVTASGNLGIDVSALVAGLGLTGFAVGFAVKDIISNWLAGILILVYEPFRRGDYVSIAGTPGLAGSVVAIDFRYTSLQTDDQLVLVPNANLFTKEIIVKRASGVPAP